MQRKLIVGILLLLLFLIGGCARTVTQKSDAGSELDILVRFKGPVDTSGRNYYIIFPKSAYNISTLAPLNYGYEPYPWFDAPKGNDNLPAFNDRLNQQFPLQQIGDQLVSDFINYYYVHYYSNWYDYIEVRGSSVLLHRGPFSTSGNVSTTDNVSQISYISQSDPQSDPAQLSLAIPINLLSNNYAKGDSVYFFIMTVNSFQVTDWIPDVSAIKNQSNEFFPRKYDDAYSQNGDLSGSPGMKIDYWEAYIR